MYTLSIQKEISAAHQLRNYEGPCARVHGHNWKIRVDVLAGRLDQVGIAIDFTEIEDLLWRVIGPFDHSNFNDIAPFNEINPTAENISRFVYRKMAELLPEGITMKSVQLWETDLYRVSYEE
jgi:6-pyruvoyltetrahydropterin/6-carboxytetrahydropterin synthase